MAFFRSFSRMFLNRVDDTKFSMPHVFLEQTQTNTMRSVVVFKTVRELGCVNENPWKAYIWNLEMYFWSSKCATRLQLYYTTCVSVWLLDGALLNKTSPINMYYCPSKRHGTTLRSTLPTSSTILFYYSFIVDISIVQICVCLTWSSSSWSSVSVHSPPASPGCAERRVAGPCYTASLLQSAPAAHRSHPDTQHSSQQFTAVQKMRTTDV